MIEELVERLVSEIEKHCGDSCPCFDACHARNDDECFSNLRNWLNSDDGVDTVATWVRSELSKAMED